METLNIQCIEQQQVLITLTLTDSNGAPVDLTKYAVYAASVGAVDPYCRRAARLEWAAAINNECSAFIITAPGHDIARAPWKYQICIKNRQLGLEWAVVTGRVELTPRACGTDGIAPASYSVACEATPSGLVNVTLDATVGSISETLEQVKASAAAAAAAAQNAHADLEDAETAATRASQAALAAAADAKVASDKATAAEAAATAAPEACAPFVGQVQAAAVQAQQAATHAEEDANRASTAATTATEKAQIATDAAAAAATSATDLASARDTAVQASTAAQAAQQTAQLASTTATTAAENAREYAEDAQQAQQAAATSETNASTSAQHAADSASAAAASAATAQASAATAVSAKSDLETARDTATSAAATATDAATAASTSETNATSAATAASTAKTAAEAAQAQADTDARAVAILVPRAEAAQQAAANSASAAAASETAAAASATAAAASAQELLDEELGRMVDLAAATYGLMEMGGIKGRYVAPAVNGKYRMLLHESGANGRADILISTSPSYNAAIGYGDGFARVVYTPKTTYIGGVLGSSPFPNGKRCYLHAPALTSLKSLIAWRGNIDLYFSSETKFEYVTYSEAMFAYMSGGAVHFPSGVTLSALQQANNFMAESTCFVSLPDTITLENVVKLNKGFFRCAKLENLPSAINLGKVDTASGLFYGCVALEIDDIIRVCNTLQDLQALETPTTGPLGLPVSCKHNGETIDTQSYLNANHPDFLTTLAAKGWTVSFA